MGEVHADGEIWSRALWDIRTALGDTTASHADRRRAVRLRARTPRSRRAALATVDAAQRLYGTTAASGGPGGVRGPRHPLTGGAVPADAGRDGAHRSDDRATGKSKYLFGYGSAVNR